MSRSSAALVAYDLRPVKQTERRIIVDLLRTARGSGIDVTPYTYIGMGGPRFYDFEMLHKYLGIRSMISLEQDTQMIQRCKFNKPFGFIRLLSKDAAEFIDEYEFNRPVVIWLDYDWGLSRIIKSDIFALAAKLPMHSFLFVTIRAELPGPRAHTPVEAKIEFLREELGELALPCGPSDVGRDGYPKYVERVLTATFKSAFSGAAFGTFFPLLRVLYRDTTWMATVGGVLSDRRIGNKLLRNARFEFPFLFPTQDGPFELADLNFTSRERVLLDHAVTCKSERKIDTKKLRKLGFDQEQVDVYRNVVRFMPKYVETFM